uniref:C-type lectin domain-containing protein n=1 Tax=Pundamilia nyererei TaxID=303518 RepID=A0A3B4H6Q9_9CICH
MKFEHKKLRVLCLGPSSWLVYSYPRTFFCYRAIVVGEEKTWEEALEYCREHHNDLASVASETETMLIQRELRKHNTTNNVWIGLRFLSRDWLWVDGQEMDYEAWSEEGKPLCPHPKMKNDWWFKTFAKCCTYHLIKCKFRREPR